VSSGTLHELSGFARGFVLAQAWAKAQGAPPTPGAGDRISPLHPRAIDEVLERVATLAADELTGLRGEWLVSEPERKLEPELDLHWSWLPDALQGEAPALIVLLLHSITPEVAKEVLRAMWPRLRNVPSRELEASAPSEAWMAGVRRHFLTRFALVSAEAPRALAPLLHLPRRELHLLLQETGLAEIANAGGSDLPRELDARLEQFDGIDAARARRLLKRGEEIEATRRELARRHLATALEAAGAQGDLVGCAAFDHLGAILSRAPREEAVYFAQRLKREEGMWLLERRDAWASEATLEVEPLRALLLKRIATVVSRSAVPTVANRVWA